MAREFGGRVRFTSENYGESALAKRFGVTRYPAIFVDDILVATPNDFGFYAKEGGSGGRYAPIKNVQSHERFRSDLARMIRKILEGRPQEARAVAAPAASAAVATLPALQMTDLAGRTLAREDLAGRVVLVEFWATWCPPCRGTLGWLGELHKRYGDRVAVLALSVESEEPEVRKVMADVGAPLRWALATPEIARAFGDVSAVPTLLLFDATGRAAGAFYGAPPTLHAEAEKKIDALLAQKP